MPATISYQQLQMQNRVRELVDEATAANEERRKDERYPYFRPAAITLAAGTEISVFCHEISRSGLGLLAATRLPDCDGVVVLQSNAGKLTQLSGKVAWCQPLEEGWFVAGFTFGFAQ